MNKKTNIKTVIRKIVREEVALAIQEVITELKQPTQQVSKQKRKIIEGKQPYKKYTDNSVLNDVLNETAQDESWKTVGNNSEESTVDQLVTSMGVAPSTVDNGVKKALNRDYSELVKAMDKQPRGKIINGSK